MKKKRSICEDVLEDLVKYGCYMEDLAPYAFIDAQKVDFYQAIELVERIESIQERLMGRILEFYSLNDDERKTYADYKFVIMIGFYPNVMFMNEMLKGDQEQKVIEFLKLVCV